MSDTRISDDNDLHPFMIEARFNEKMGWYEIRLQVGGFKTEADLDKAVQEIAHFIGGDDAEVMTVKGSPH